MNFLDYAVVLIYILGFLYLGRLFKNNSSGEDYFLGNKQFGWFPLTVSTAATQLSAISFVSAPAFVGWRAGGGMKWLTYEFAVPLAMAFLLVYLIPPLFASGQISVYGYLEKRFGGSTRRLLSGFFLLSRGFATSVMLYTVALILSGVMGIPMTASILVMGVVTLIYSLQGGMKAVVYGDVIQMGVLFLGILIMLGFGLHLLGGWGSFLEQVDTDRLTVVDWGKMGYGAQDDFGFFPMLIGGFFLYASYYGTDQSQVQRLFSAPDRKTLGKTLLFNGLFRFPVTLIYCIMGLVLGTFALSTPAFAEAIPAERPDYLVPIFIRDYLPHGVVGLLVVAIFSAAMSSLSSGINSLSAATVEDFFASRRVLSTEVYLRYSKYAVGFWGVICVGLAFFTGGIA
ncbi:MAG: sodium/solute symporter, partial [Bacteroidota bacterium]